MTNLGAVAILTVARSSLQHCAGPGCPLPYIGRCNSAVPSRDCTPRALPRASRSGRHVGLRPPRNDKSLAFTNFMIACFLRRCSAGRGMPLPYSAQPLAVPSPAAPRRCPVQLPNFCTFSFKIFPPLSPDLAHCAAHPSSGGRTPEFVQIREKKEKFYANFC